MKHLRDSRNRALSFGQQVRWLGGRHRALFIRYTNPKRSRADIRLSKDGSEVNVRVSNLSVPDRSQREFSFISDVNPLARLGENGFPVS